MKIISYFILIFLFYSHFVLAKFHYQDIDFIEYTSYLDKNWTEIKKDHVSNVRILFNVLDHSKIGREVIFKVKNLLKREGKSLNELIQIGETSQVKSSYIRYLDRENDIKVKKVSTIILAQNLILKDAVLELAHEMVHFLKKEMKTPYDKNFSAEYYLKEVIEGEGGEVDAFFTECQVALDLFPKDLNSFPTCSNLTIEIDGRKRIIKSEIKKELYKVGNYITPLRNLMLNLNLDQNNFPEISEQKPRLISGAYSLPYPLAVLHDFNLIAEKVKKNQKNLKN